MATNEALSLENDSAIAFAYAYCQALAKTHYENFPVASFLLPRAIQQPIAVIYAFARSADDIADEGDLTPEARLTQLSNFENGLKNLECTPEASPCSPIFIALNDVFKKNPHLPIQLLFDLLTAFKQDVTKNQYRNLDELLHYCQYSANPVGRLLLHLTHHASIENLTSSDNICTALQLINFLQDVHDDMTHRKRFYFPNTHPETLLKTISVIEKCLTQGKSLIKNLRGLFGFEIRLIFYSAKRMVYRLKKRKVLDKRPTLGIWDGVLILMSTLASYIMTP